MSNSQDRGIKTVNIVISHTQKFKYRCRRYKKTKKKPNF